MELPEHFKEYKQFLTSDKHKIPSSDVDYVDFADTFLISTPYAGKKLEKLLKKCEIGATAKLEKGVFAEFALIGHGDTETNTKGGLTGHSGAMLNEDGKKVAQEHRETLTDRIKEKTQVVPSLIISSDLPRAIHHALITFGNISDDEEKQLKDIQTRVDENQSVGREDYNALVTLALNHNIVPTPLARAQFYGRLELSPEKFELKDKDKKSYKRKTLDALADLYCSIKEKLDKKTKTALKDFIEDFIKLRATGDRKAGQMRALYQECMRRKDSAVCRKNKKGKPEDENRLFFYYRVDTLFSIFEKMKKNNLKDRRVDIVAHSGFIDVALCYFRHKGNLDEFHLVNRPKQDSRGEQVVVKVDKKFKYLNDVAQIEKIKENSRKVAKKQRGASLDPSIKEGNGIIPVELFGFDEKEEAGRTVYAQKQVSIDDLMDSPELTLILGEFGVGKSTASVYLTEFLNDKKKMDKKEDKKKYERHVVVLNTARHITDELRNIGRHITGKHRKPEGKEFDKALLGLLTGGLNKNLYLRSDSWRFVFVIDAFDELSEEYRLHVLKATEEMHKYGKVIITSRIKEAGFDEHENKGFETLHADPEAVIRNLDAYLEARIPSDKRAEFNELFAKQDDAVRKNYLLVHLLTDLYKTRRKDLGDLDKPLSDSHVLIKGMELALYDHKLPKRDDLPKEPIPFDGETPESFKSREKAYEKYRSDFLDKLMGFLQRAAAYMTVHGLRSLNDGQLKEIYGTNGEDGWTLAKEIEKRKGQSR